MKRKDNIKCQLDNVAECSDSEVDSSSSFQSSNTKLSRIRLDGSDYKSSRFRNKKQVSNLAPIKKKRPSFKNSMDIFSNKSRKSRFGNLTQRRTSVKNKTLKKYRDSIGPMVKSNISQKILEKEAKKLNAPM